MTKTVEQLQFEKQILRVLYEEAKAKIAELEKAAEAATKD